MSATAAQAELGISAVTTDPLYADPYWMPEKIVENNLTKQKQPCVYRPFEGTGASSSSPYQWEVPPDPNWWVDAEVVVRGRYRVVVKDATTGQPKVWEKTERDALLGPDGTDVKYGMIDDIGQTMWSRISLQDNGIPIEDPNPRPYPFRYKFENILNFDDKKKYRVFKYCQNHVAETPDRGKLVKCSPAAKQRFKNLAKNEFTDFEVVLHTDFLSMDNQIPTSNELRIVLDRTSDDFIFIRDPVYETACNEAQPAVTPLIPMLELRYVELKVMKSQPSTNRRKSGVPAVTIGRMRDKAIAPNNTNFNFGNLFRGEDLPQQVLVTLLPQKAWNGDMLTDPFQWIKPKVVEACLVVDGVHYEPLEKLTNQKNGEDGHGDLDMYLSSIRAAGYQYLARDGTMDIDMDQWSNHNFFLAFDRSPGKNNSLSTIFRPKPGQHMDLVLHLKESFEETYVLLVYGIYKTYVEFNSDGTLKRVPHIIC